MIVLLSPAKSLDLTPPPAGLAHAQPPMLDEAEKLIVTARRLSRRKMAALMNVSPKIAQLNYERFQAFTTPFTPDNAKQAALAFAGDTYRGFDAGTLSINDLNYAQEHVAILSGLYGVLRPLDLMQPYRLEMGLPLSTRRGRTLYKFWGDRITAQLNTMLATRSDAMVLNCASNEYASAVKPKKLAARLVNCHFKEDRGGVLKVVSFSAKRARGMMARYVAQRRVETVDGVRRFEEAGYGYREDLSDEANVVFVRAQPGTSS